MGSIAKSNFIQWKGTDICMDFNCKCGHQNHYDGRFAYYVQCAGCKQIYKLADSIEMEEVDRAEDPIQSVLDEDELLPIPDEGHRPKIGDKVYYVADVNKRFPFTVVSDGSSKVPARPDSIIVPSQHSGPDILVTKYEFDSFFSDAPPPQ